MSGEATKGSHHSPSKNVRASNNLGVRHAKLKLATILTVGLASLAVLFVLSLTLGTIKISFFDAMDAMVSLIMKWGNPSGMDQLVICYIRMPRTIAVIAVGAGLSAAGAVMQALIKNPLVDPYITGVSSGAGLGATLAALAGVFAGLAIYAMPVCALIGAFAAFFMTMILAEGAGGRATSYVLAGVIVGIAVSAGTTLLYVFNSDKLHGILFWLFGSFAYISWEDALIIAIPVTVCLLITLLFARDLNTILLGDEQARQLGLNTGMFKKIMMILVSILTAFCVAFCGVIGFVGLIVPHVVRIITGGDHRTLLPASMVLGANVLLIADIVCRTVIIPVELPIGAIMAIIGAPFFAYLMLREGKHYAM